MGTLDVQIRIGFDMAFQCPAPTPIIFSLNVHYSRISDLLHPDELLITPSVPMSAYRDTYGNWCTRVVAPPGITRLRSDNVVNDSGLPDVVVPDAGQVPVEDLPEDTLLFLLSSRYCEVDRLSQFAWDTFGTGPEGWGRVQAICDFVHNHIRFDYMLADNTRTAAGALHDGVGVCRDFAHLAVTLCRCLNIPARYCTGYLGDIGIAPIPGPMDFSAWFEVFLGGRWYAFDARHNIPRIGRVLIARGRDAADVPLSNTFGPNTLASFEVWAHKV
ncbi:transglutaminase-like domain-containing protein [Gordonia sp. NPDC003429]